MTAALKKDERAKKRKGKAFKRSPTYDEDKEVSSRWTHGTWFPSSKPNSPIVVPCRSPPHNGFINTVIYHYQLWFADIFVFPHLDGDCNRRELHVHQW